MRRGLSLLEVVLALAILGVSLALIGELIRLGSRAGEAARDDMESQLICESIINEIAAGTQLPEPVFDEPVDELGEWLYTVETQPVDEAGLLAVRVSVRRADAIASTLNTVAPFSLTRWVMDPELEMAAREAEALMKEQLKERTAAQASGTQTDSGAAPSDPAANGGTPPGGSPNPGAGQPPGLDPGQQGPGANPGRGGRGGRGSEGGPGRGGNPDDGAGGGRGGRGGRGGGPGGGGPGGGGGRGGPGGGRGGGGGFGGPGGGRGSGS